MNDISNTIEYKNRKFNLVFNLNVMEQIQEEYGSVQRWGELTDGAGGEPNAKAVLYGFTQMLNEGIEIENDEKGTNIEPLTQKQVGRLITEVGLAEAAKRLNDTVIESTKSQEKNA